MTSTRMGLARRRLLGHFSLMGAMAMAAPHMALAAEARTLLVVGDSLSAEYGLQRGKGWVALLDQRLASDKLQIRIVNASISGDTTSGGRSRLPAVLKQHPPTHVVIELGANDALRGLPLNMTRDNLLAMVRAAKATGAKVLVVGIQVPPNYGRKYSDDFAAMYESVAKEEKVPLVPFLLKGVADAKNAHELFQADRIHPNEQAQAQMLDNVWTGLKPLLR